MPRPDRRRKMGVNMAEIEIVLPTGATPPLDLVRLGAAADELHCARVTLWRQCRKHPGLGFWLFGEWRLTRKTLEALKAGRTPAEIVAEAAQRGAQRAA